MTFNDYVSDGIKARAAENNAGQRLSELAAGVDREHGKLAEWAEAVGISQSRAQDLRRGGKVNQILVDQDCKSLPWSVGREAFNVPADKLPQVIERAVEVTRQWQPEATTPSQRGMREAAKRFAKPRGSASAVIHEAADHALVALNMAAHSIDEALVIFRDGEVTEERVRAGCNILDAIEQDVQAIRELLVSNSLEEGLAALLGG